MSQKAHAWWVTASLKKSGGGWHWDQFFRRAGGRRKVSRWGGPGWIDSHVSFARIKEMRRGDYVIAYQAGEGVAGIVKLASRGYNARGSEYFDMFDLHVSGALRFPDPIPLSVIKSLPASREIFEFVRSGRGTVFVVEPGGLERVACLGAAFNPELTTRLFRLAR